MVYLRQATVKGKKYWVLYHTIKIGNKVKHLSKYIGKALPVKRELDRLKKQFKEEITSIKEKPLLSAEQIKQLETIKAKYQKHLKKLTPSDIEKLEEYILANFTYNTNAIEGSKLSLADVQSIFKGVMPQGKDLREIYGAENMRKAYNYIKTMKRLSEKKILELHKIVMQDILATDLGKYRAIQVYVGNHIPPPSKEVKALMKELLNWYKFANKKLHAFEVACLLHAKFELIHPFRDGNGRVGRLLMNFVLSNAGYPLLDIKLDLRPGYYAALDKTKFKEFKPFIDYAFETYLSDAKKRRWR